MSVFKKIVAILLATCFAVVIIGVMVGCPVYDISQEFFKGNLLIGFGVYLGGATIVITIIYVLAWACMEVEKMIWK